MVIKSDVDYEEFMIDELIIVADLQGFSLRKHSNETTTAIVSTQHSAQCITKNCHPCSCLVQDALVKVGTLRKLLFAV